MCGRHGKSSTTRNTNLMMRRVYATPSGTRITKALKGTTRMNTAHSSLKWITWGIWYQIFILPHFFWKLWNQYFVTISSVRSLVIIIEPLNEWPHPTLQAEALEDWRTSAHMVNHTPTQHDSSFYTQLKLIPHEWKYHCVVQNILSETKFCYFYP